mgnify:CR=1 FL=1
MADPLVDRRNTSQTWLSKEVTLLAQYLNGRLVLRVIHAEVADVAAHVYGVLGSGGFTPKGMLVVLYAIGVDVAVVHVLPAE